MTKKTAENGNPCLSCPKYGIIPYYSTEEYGCMDNMQICQKAMDYWQEEGRNLIAKKPQNRMEVRKCTSKNIYIP